jgi:predicted RNase H-like nuclease (RuvC/YqgF family)
MFRLFRPPDQVQTGNVKLSREQIEARKEQAVRFVRDVLGDPDRADEIADESLEDYAERRKFEITNPKRRAIMPRKTVEDYREEVADLKDQLAELEEENESLQSQLDQIADIAAGEEEEEDEEDEDEQQPGE